MSFKKASIPINGKVNILIIILEKLYWADNLKIVKYFPVSVKFFSLLI